MELRSKSVLGSREWPVVQKQLGESFSVLPLFGGPQEAALMMYGVETAR